MPNKIYAFDRSRYHNDGTISGAVWKQQPNGLWALVFDGVDDNIQTPAMSGMNVGTGNISSIIWLKTPADIITGQVALRCNYSVDTDAWGTYIEAGEVVTHFRNAAMTIRKAINAIVANTWYMITGVRLSSTVYGYINNASMATTAVADADQSLTGHQFSRIGQNSQAPGTNYGGTISDVLIFNRALNLTEIQQYYEATKWRY
jgi:hypothetical protein